MNTSIKPSKLAARPWGERRAFTLIEILGVLTIIIIMSALAAENVLESVKNAKRSAEVTSLANIVTAFQTAALKSKSLPAASNWYVPVFNTMNVSPDRITNNSSGWQRAFLYDPAFNVGTTTSSVPPYTQGNTGSVQPVMTSARLLVVSSLAGSLPTIATDAATFSNLWNTAAYAVPPGWTGALTNSGADLKIQRLNLSSLFSCVVLENNDPTNSAYYSVETNAVATLAPATRRQMWLINTSVLNFYASNNVNSLLSRTYVNGSVGFTFEYGNWGGTLQFGNPAWFGQMAYSFLAAPNPPGKLQRYPKQQSVADAMSLYLYYFGQWSLDNFSATNPAPAQSLSAAAASTLTNVAWDLIK